MAQDCWGAFLAAALAEQAFSCRGAAPSLPDDVTDGVTSRAPVVVGQRAAFTVEQTEVAIEAEP